MTRYISALVLIAALLGCSRHGEDGIRRVGKLDAGTSFTAYLVAYGNDGLKLHAMVAVPRHEMPPAGYPVVIANHGYVPDPRKYGITADGRDSRPGDYYRSVPELYAARGFLVVLPDYRGHNSSEGYAQIADQNRESVSLYAEDVAVLMSALGQIEHADTENVFMWSHSMGGQVALRVLLETEIVKAASFWSTADVAELAPRVEWLTAFSMIQHCTGDETTPLRHAEELAAALTAADRPHELLGHSCSDHFFEAGLRETAADRDASLFRSFMSRP